MTALLTGATAGLSGTATRAVQDAYQALCAAVQRRLAERGEHLESGGELLEAYVADPVGHYDALAGSLATADAGDDPRLREAAGDMFALTYPASEQSVRKFTVTLHDARGVVVGDHSTQTNTFS
ncbi:hypothetical protein [Krasilnikovia sp. M28-CT-15]|uniref:hypothetical protein n=1 Tax=Krasilnikovia sp. M28-CT-15 TaxID=3373540 RepID=UPI00399D3F2D